MRAASETVVANALRRQGIKVGKIKSRPSRAAARSGNRALYPPTGDNDPGRVPLLQAFDIAAQHGQQSPVAPVAEMKGDVEPATACGFVQRHPMQFDSSTATWSVPASRPVFSTHS